MASSVHAWDELGDGVFRRRYQSLDLNVGVVAGSAGLLVVDSRASHRQARELLREVKALSAAPVRFVVNTHYHWDHCWGNALFPDADIWGHAVTRDTLLGRGEEMKEAIRSIASDPAEIDEIEITPPEYVFEDRQTIDIGDRAVDLRYLGRGHTDSDIVVIVPDAEVIFAGDLVEEGAPPSFGDSYPVEWPATLGRLSALVHGVVVPGHGDVVDQAYVDGQREELQAVADLVATSDADLSQGPYPLAVMQAALARLGDIP